MRVSWTFRASAIQRKRTSRSKPQSFQDNPHKGRQKDTDARWAKKNQETHFGYKNHVSVDNKHKLIRSYEVTSAEVHDSNRFVEVLADNTSKDVWAGSAYSSQENEIALEAMEYRSRVHKKGTRKRALSERTREANHKKSKIRCRVEHVFGSMTNEQGGLFSRVVGQARTELKIGMMNVMYNMRRFVSLYRKRAS